MYLSQKLKGLFVVVASLAVVVTSGQALAADGGEMLAKIRHRVLHEGTEKDTKAVEQLIKTGHLNKVVEQIGRAKASNLPSQHEGFVQFWQDFKIALCSQNGPEMAKHIEFPLSGGAGYMYGGDSLTRAEFLKNPGKLFNKETRFLAWNVHGEEMNCHGETVRFIAVWVDFEDDGNFYESGVIYCFEKRGGSYKLVNIELAG